MDIFEKAQQDYNKAQREVENVQKKLEAIKKKSDEIKKIALEFKQYTTKQGIKGGLSSMVATQVGKIKANVTSKVQQQILKTLTKFSNQCPSPRELERLVKVRNNLLTQVQKAEKRVQSFSKLGTLLKGTITGLQTAITVIKNVPVPTAIIPPSGGTGVPISVLTRYSDSLIQLDKKLERYGNEVTSIEQLVQTVLPVLSNIKSKLKLIDIAIEGCVKASGISTNIQLFDSIQISDTEKETRDRGTFTLGDGRVISYEVILDPNSPKVAPRRYAIARDSSGRTVFRGEPSFSSSTDVLIREIQFKLENNIN